MNREYFWEKKSLANLVLLILVAAIIFLFAKAYGEVKGLKFIGQGVEFRNTIAVSGIGETTVIPDVAQFSFAVVKESKTTEEAQLQVTDSVDSLLGYLKEFGVKDEDVKTTSYNISPRYEYNNNELVRYPSFGTRELVGYEVSHWVRIKVRNLDILGSIVGEIGSRGATNISSIQFTVEDEEVVRSEAREIAIKNAKAKAKVLAKDLGVDLVKIISFNESGGYQPYRAYAVAESAKIDGDSGFKAPELPAGENTVTSNITIIYAIN